VGVSRLFGVIFLHGNGVEGLIKARSWDDTLFICFLLGIFVFGSIARSAYIAEYYCFAYVVE
jgi:hypothetical protein